MPRYEQIKCIKHAASVLRAAAVSPSGLRLLEFQVFLGLKRTTTQNLVRTLVAEGLLEKVSNPIRYRLAPAMESLQRPQASWRKRVLTAATPIAIRLARRIDAEVSVSRYVAGVVLAGLVVPPNGQGSVQKSDCWPLLPYGTGLLPLAYMDAEERRKFRLRHPLGGTDLDFWKSEGLVDEFLARVRTEGYLCIYRDGIFRAAAPIFDRRGTMNSMVSAVKLLSDMAPGEGRYAVEQTRLAAEHISQSLLGGANNR